MTAKRSTRHYEETDERLTERVLGEYREMPGLALTLTQAARLWGLTEATCLRVAAGLTERGLLRQMADGRLILTD